MTRGNTYVCATCGKEYEYCPRCAITKPTYDAERYCCHEHADIFATLSKNGCGLATAEDTLEVLKSYNTTGLTESIQAHIKSLQPAKTEAKKEVETTKKYSFKTQE